MPYYTKDSKRDRDFDQDPFGCFLKLGVPFVGALAIRPLLFEVYMRPRILGNSCLAETLKWRSAWQGSYYSMRYKQRLQLILQGSILRSWGPTRAHECKDLTNHGFCNPPCPAPWNQILGSLCGLLGSNSCRDSLSPTEDKTAQNPLEASTANRHGSWSKRLFPDKRETHIETLIFFDVKHSTYNTAKAEF